MKQYLISIFYLLFFTGSVIGHPFKPGHFILIDTDGGIDDMRTICMLLSSPDTRVLGITISPGVLSSENTYIKVKSLLTALYHEGIPVGITQTGIRGNDCEGALNAEWGDEENIMYSDIPDGTEIVNSVFNYSTDPITYICLGSLKPIEVFYLNIPSFSKKIKKIVWSNNRILTPAGFNHELSPQSFEAVKQMHLPIEVVNGEALPGVNYNESMIKMISELNTPGAKVVSASFNVAGRFRYQWFDEMVAVYLHYPELFTADTIEDVPFFQFRDSVLSPSLGTAFCKILSGETVIMNQVLRTVSVDTSGYQKDIVPIVNETIRSYGKTEWVSGVLANELHRHLGIYAIVGVKMGIRALEYFGAGIDEMNVVSFSGIRPPYSCLNDGLQVSTGATLGHGLIKVSIDSLIRPVAEFTYMGKTIRIALNAEVSKKISSDVKELNIIYGLDSSIYWELIRQLAIKYWSTLDRHSIFEITAMPDHP